MLLLSSPRSLHSWLAKKGFRMYESISMLWQTHKSSRDSKDDRTFPWCWVQFEESLRRGVRVRQEEKSSLIAQVANIPHSRMLSLSSSVDILKRPIRDECSFSASRLEKGDFRHVKRLPRYGIWRGCWHLRSRSCPVYNQRRHKPNAASTWNPKREKKIDRKVSEIAVIKSNHCLALATLDGKCSIEY